MPGRTPAEAVEQFLASFRVALSAVAQAKITVRRGGLAPRVGADQQWSLNDGMPVTLSSNQHAGSGLPTPLALHAHMYWRVIEDERPSYGPYRVTTLGYEYVMLCGAEAAEVWAMHWHPSGRSDEITPHLHLGLPMLAANGPVDNKEHLPTGRMTFEDAIRWLIKFGVSPVHDDWDNRLILAESPHKLYRSWHRDPAEASTAL